MPQLAVLTLINADTTLPSVFVPQGVVGGVASFEDLSGGSVDMNKNLSISLARPSKTSNNTRVRVRLTKPYINAAGLTKVCYFDGTFTFPKDATVVDRTEVRELIVAALADLSFVAVVDTSLALY